MTIPTLKELCKERAIPKISRLTKPQLIEIILEYQALDGQTVAQLKRECEDNNIPSPNKSANKAQWVLTLLIHRRQHAPTNGENEQKEEKQKEKKASPPKANSSAGAAAQSEGKALSATRRKGSVQNVLKTEGEDGKKLEEAKASPSLATSASTGSGKGKTGRSKSPKSHDNNIEDDEGDVEGKPTTPSPQKRNTEKKDPKQPRRKGRGNKKIIDQPGGDLQQKDLKPQNTGKMPQSQIEDVEVDEAPLEPRSVVIISHNVKHFSRKNKSCEIKTKNLAASYVAGGTKQRHMPDLLVLQEVKRKNSPTMDLVRQMNQLCGSSKSSPVERLYTSDDSEIQDDRQECTSFIYDAKRMVLLECLTGVPIQRRDGHPNHLNSLLKTNKLSQRELLDPGFAKRCGFKEDELRDGSRFDSGHNIPGDKLFARTPVYARFNLLDPSGQPLREIVVVSVHLAAKNRGRSEKLDQELRHLQYLLPVAPPSDKEVILGGDLNIDDASSYQEFHRNDSAAPFSIPTPFDNIAYVYALKGSNATNLGRDYLGETGGKHYDNFIIRRQLYDQMRVVTVLKPPQAFIAEIFSLQQSQEGIVTRSHSVGSVAQRIFSDHLPIYLRITF